MQPVFQKTWQNSLRLFPAVRRYSILLEQYIQGNMQFKEAQPLFQFFGCCITMSYLNCENMMECLEQNKKTEEAGNLLVCQKWSDYIVFICFISAEYFSISSALTRLTVKFPSWGEATSIPVCFPSSARVSWYMLNIWSQWAITLLRILSQWGASSPKSLSSWFLYQKAKRDGFNSLIR